MTLVELFSLQIFIFVACNMSVVVSSFFFFKQKTAYEMRISDWSSDVCSSDLILDDGDGETILHRRHRIEELALGVQRDVRRREPVDPDDGRAADRKSVV